MASTIFNKPSQAIVVDVISDEKGVANGLAELNADGKVPTSQLPSYVDDVLEYYDLASLPETGESGKIYVTLNTNKTYRWSGTAYVEISPSLALGETDATAYRGDRGKTAYDHAAAKGSEFASGLYKITTNAEGHITAAVAVEKSDITALGIPEQDTNTTYSFTNNNPTLSWGNTSTVGTVGGVTLTVKMPSNPDTNTTYSFTDKAPTLAWNTTSTVGVVGGVALTVKMPANPNTDTNTTYSFTNKAPTLAWNTTSTVGVAGGVAFTVKMPANPNTNTTYGTVSKSSAGLCPALPNETSTTKYLRQDGSWQVPPNTDTNTTYAFTNKAPTLAWNTTSTVGVAGGVAFTVKMPGNPNTNTTYAFTNKAPTLSWGNTSTVGVAGGVAFTVKMPSNPDTNTWRGIQNNLTSTSTTESLSAAQGKALNDKFSNYVYGNWTDVGTQVTHMAGQLSPPTGTNYIRVHIRCSNGSVAYCDFVKYG